MALTYLSGERIQGLSYTAASSDTHAVSTTNGSVATAGTKSSRAQECGFRVNAGHILVGKRPTTITIGVFRASGLTSGVMKIAWRRASDSDGTGTALVDSATVNNSTLSVGDYGGGNYNWGDVTFTFPSGAETIEAGDYFLTNATVATGNDIKNKFKNANTESNIEMAEYPLNFNSSYEFVATVVYSVAAVGDEKPTNVPVGTRYEETDTRKIFRRTGTPYIADWIEKDSAGVLDITRGVFAGGKTSSVSDVMDYITISTTGNATDFGNIVTARTDLWGLSGGTRGLICGGETFEGTPTTFYNQIDYITIATTGNAADFGDLTVARRSGAGFSSSTRGVSFAGRDWNNSSYNTMDYVTMATLGNAADFGDLSSARLELAGCSSETRGLVAGGSSTNIIEYVTIATTGNTTDFGDLTVARNQLTGVDNSVRGVFAGGTSNTIDYVTIATTGNATDFGDLSVSRTVLGGVHSYVRGVFGGGWTGSTSDVIDYITIDTVGNAADFGNLSVSRQVTAGMEGA